MKLLCFSCLTPVCVPPKRLISGKGQKAKSGDYNGGRVPFGYSYVDHKFLVNADQADVVQSIFNLFNAGESLNGIVRHLNNLGAPTVTGKGGWFVNGVKHILANGSYAGIGQWDGTESDQGTHPAIIDRATYEQV